MSDELIKERFENVTTMIRYHNDKMIEAFARFIKISVGIVAGSFWILSLDKLGQNIKQSAISTVPILFWFVGISSLAIIYSNWKSWYGFRQAETSILKGSAQEPKLPGACKEQLIMAAIILIVCVVFTCWSPLPNKL
jgi:hypothetical protein